MFGLLDVAGFVGISCQGLCDTEVLFRLHKKFIGIRMQCTLHFGSLMARQCSHKALCLLALISVVVEESMGFSCRPYIWWFWTRELSRVFL